MSQRAFSRDGVELIVKGFDKFLSDLDKSGAKWDKTVNRFRDATGRFVEGTQVGPAFDKMRGHLTTARTALDDLSKGMKGPESGFTKFLKNAALGAGQSLGLNTAITALTGGVGALGLAVGSAAIQIGQTLVDALQNAVKATADLLAESLQLAGTYEEMELTALAVGSAMGLSRAEIEDASKNVQDMGIRADVANKAVAQLARNNLELADATDLVRIAQATGIIMQRDSSEEMDALTHAAISGATIMLRRRGIFVDNELALRKYADTIGKHVDALTMQEKAQARLNEIIIQGQRVLGVYDAAMKSPTKQLRTLTGRELPALKAALGAPFLDAWAGAIGIVRDFVGRLTDLISEGGALYPVLINLGAAASLLADGLRTGYDAVIDFLEGLEIDMGEGILGVAESAFTWGVEIVAQLAEGMVSATTTVLVSAMNAISSLLSFWMAPGSAPKIAPNLRKWGMSAMIEYLEGMTSADFDILESIQQPLSKVLEGPAFANVSKSLAKALAGDDRGAFLDIVANATKMFGEEVTDLAKVQFNLADATKAVEMAEAALASARDRVTSSQKKVNKLTDEYNQLLRMGASRDILDAQLNQINAAEKQRNLAVDQVSTSEEALKLAKDRETEAKDEASLQKRLLDQILGVNTALTEREKKAKVARAKKGKAGPLADVLPEPKDFDITSRISQAIDDAKLALKGKFDEIFKPLRDAWDEMKEDLDIVGDAWDTFSEKVGLAFDTLKEKFPFLEDLETLLANLPEKMGLAFDTLEEKSSFFEDLETLLANLPEKVEDIREAFAPLIDDTWTRLVTFWEDDLKPTFESLEALLGTIVSTGLEPVIAAFDNLFKDAKAGSEFLEEHFIPTWEETLAKALLWVTEKVIEPLNTGLDSLSGWLETVRERFDELTIAIEGIDMGPLFAFLGFSPSPLEVGLRGINEAMAELSQVRFPGLNRALSLRPSGVSLPAPSPSFQGMGGGTSINNSFQLGGNTIANGMDAAQFEAMVVRVIRREIQTG